MADRLTLRQALNRHKTYIMHNVRLALCDCNDINRLDPCDPGLTTAIRQSIADGHWYNREVYGKNYSLLLKCNPTDPALAR